MLNLQGCHGVNRKSLDLKIFIVEILFTSLEGIEASQPNRIFFELVYMHVPSSPLGTSSIFL